MSAFLPAEAVRINRPGRPFHEAVGRYVEPSQDPNLHWVSLHSTNRQELPAERNYRKQHLYAIKLFPLSQLEKHES